MYWKKNDDPAVGKSYSPRSGEWEPSQEDIAWTKQLIATLKEGGGWGVPGSRTLFVFFRSAKEYVIREPKDEPRAEVNRRIIKVLGILGWKERKVT